MRRLDAFSLAVVLLLAAYAALGLSPSSYGVTLARLGQPGAGLVFGEPRAIREDEWARWTPQVQAAVANDFARTNRTSLYHEDLRNVEGVPLRDWGLAFRPYYWAFFLLPPAAAFSLAHAFWIGAFLLGYHHLLRALGSERAVAAAASTALFFSAFVQLWWTTYGPMLAGFPWVLLAVLAPLRPLPHMATVAFAATSWLLAMLYPPIQITLAFAGALMLLGLRRDAWRPRRLVPALLGLASGAALALLYYQDAFRAMSGTLYPGQRVMSGGGEPAVQWLAQLFPFLVTSRFEPLVSENICEASTVGTFVPLLWLCFADRRAWALRPAAARRRAWLDVAPLALGVLLGSLWLLAPVPSALGKLLLWHFVPAERLWFVCGFLLLLVTLRLLTDTPLRVTWPRAAVFGAVVVAGWLASESVLGGRRSGFDLADLGVLAPLAAVLALRARLGRWLPAALVGSAACANALGFGGFNPLQSARPIFEAPRLAAVRPLERLVARHPEGRLVLYGGYGTTLNGLGFASASHVLLAPELGFFRSLFPALPAPELETVFNRTAYVVLSLKQRPEVSSESVVTVPIDAYAPPTLGVTLGGISGRAPPGGRVTQRSVFTEEGRVVLQVDGWLAADASDPATRLFVATELPLGRAVAYPALRPDGSAPPEPALLVSGFALRLELAPGAAPPHALAPRICLVSEDPRRGRHALVEPGAPPCASAPSRSRISTMRSPARPSQSGGITPAGPGEASAAR